MDLTLRQSLMLLLLPALLCNPGRSLGSSRAESSDQPCLRPIEQLRLPRVARRLLFLHRIRLQFIL